MEKLHLNPYFIYDGIRHNLTRVIGGWAAPCPACGRAIHVEIYAMTELGAITGDVGHECGWQVWCHDGFAEDI